MKLCQKMSPTEEALRLELEKLVSVFLGLPIAEGFHVTIGEEILRNPDCLEAAVIPAPEGETDSVREILQAAITKMGSDGATRDERWKAMKSMGIRRAYYEGHIRDHNLNGQFPELEDPLKSVADARTALNESYAGLTEEYPNIDANTVLEATWNASRRYDPSIAYGFPAYAHHWIIVFAERGGEDQEAQQDEEADAG